MTGPSEGFDCTQGENGTSICTPICGDKLLVFGETCDDGNQQSNDGCSLNCLIEDFWECLILGSPCKTICGDGVKIGLEECDDLNKDDTDTCSNECKV